MFKCDMIDELYKDDTILCKVDDIYQLLKDKYVFYLDSEVDMDALVGKNRGITDRKMDLITKAFTPFAEKSTHIKVAEDFTPQKPVKKMGVQYLPFVLRFDDGQTVTVLFRNFGKNDAKLTDNEQHIAVKWFLNKRDINVLVSPENGKDIGIKKIASEIVKLADMNHLKFKKKNTDTVVSKIQNIDKEIDVLSKEIDSFKIYFEDKGLFKEIEEPIEEIISKIFENNEEKQKIDKLKELIKPLNNVEFKKVEDLLNYWNKTTALALVYAIKNGNDTDIKQGIKAVELHNAGEGLTIEINNLRGDLFFRLKPNAKENSKKFIKGMGKSYYLEEKERGFYYYGQKAHLEIGKELGYEGSPQEKETITIILPNYANDYLNEIKIHLANIDDLKDYKLVYNIDGVTQDAISKKEVKVIGGTPRIKAKIKREIEKRTDDFDYYENTEILNIFRKYEIAKEIPKLKEIIKPLNDVRFSELAQFLNIRAHGESLALAYAIKKGSDADIKQGLKAIELRHEHIHSQEAKDLVGDLLFRLHFTDKERTEMIEAFSRETYEKRKKDGDFFYGNKVLLEVGKELGYEDPKPISEIIQNFVDEENSRKIYNRELKTVKAMNKRRDNKRTNVYGKIINFLETTPHEELQKLVDNEALMQKTLADYFPFMEDPEANKITVTLPSGAAEYIETIRKEIKESGEFGDKYISFLIDDVVYDAIDIREIKLKNAGRLGALLKRIISNATKEYDKEFKVIEKKEPIDVEVETTDYTQKIQDLYNIQTSFELYEKMDDLSNEIEKTGELEKYNSELIKVADRVMELMKKESETVSDGVETKKDDKKTLKKDKND